MGEFGKVVRWSAPGSVFILMTVAFTCVGHVVFKQSIWPKTTHDLSFPWAELSSGGVALAALASVPLGFLIYQIYFFGYSRPQPLALSFVHLDVALRVQEQLAQVIVGVSQPMWVVRRTPGLFLRMPRHTRVPGSGRFTSLWLFKPPGSERTTGGMLTPGTEIEAATAGDAEEGLTVPYLMRTQGASKREARRAYRKVLDDYARNRENNWIRLESELHRKLRDRPGSGTELQAIERLADVFHTLGAAKTAVAYAWVAGFAWTAWGVAVGSGGTAIWWQTGVLLALVLGASFLLGAALYLLLHENRRHCLHRRIALITSTFEGHVGASDPG